MMIADDSYRSFLILLRIWGISSAFRTYQINFNNSSRLPKVKTDFFEKYICRDINASIHFFKIFQ